MRGMPKIIYIAHHSDHNSCHMNSGVLIQIVMNGYELPQINCIFILVSWFRVGIAPQNWLASLFTLLCAFRSIHLSIKLITVHSRPARQYFSLHISHWQYKSCSADLLQQVFFTLAICLYVFLLRRKECPCCLFNRTIILVWKLFNRPFLCMKCFDTDVIPAYGIVTNGHLRNVVS